MIFDRGWSAIAMVLDALLFLGLQRTVFTIDLIMTSGRGHEL
jgi:hypothetical protein